LRSICIPSSVEIMGDSCFGSCTSLSSLTFESGSKIARINWGIAPACPLLDGIFVPAWPSVLPPRTDELRLDVAPSQSIDPPLFARFQPFPSFWVLLSLFILFAFFICRAVSEAPFNVPLTLLE
jgi:hypothetical protein